MSDHYPIYIPHDGPPDARIMFVGEAGGEEEMNQHKPFIGPSGEKLTTCLGRAGVKREDVFLANLSHYRPYNNKFETLLQSQVLKDGLKELYEHIAIRRPTVIGALGGYPLMFLTGRKGIKKWRGSILSYINDPSIKVIPTIHPAAVLRDRSLYPIFDADIKRIVGDSAFPEKRLPIRRFICDPRGLELEEWTQRLCEAELLGTDIETVKNSRRILCCGFAPSPDLAVCINAEHHEGKRAIQRILLSRAKKIFQLGTFDTIQLIYLNGYEIRDVEAQKLERPYFWDTLVAQHILAPELPRSLEYLTSVYTREPYYKTVGRGSIPDDEKGWSEKVEKQTLYEYNCRDCCCTIEVALQQMEELSREPITMQNIFAFEMSLLNCTRDISVAGMLVDEERRAKIEEVLLKKWGTKQFVLDRLTGFETNVRSTKLKKILYEHLGLPTKRNRDGSVTTDEDAIVALITFCKNKIEGYKRAELIMEWKVKLAVCQTILEIRGIRQTLSNYIRTHSKKGIPRISSDGRIRSTYKIGPETGRLSASKYVDGTGFAAQTMPRDPIEIPDADMVKPLPSAELVSQIEDEPDADDEAEEEAA
jgi:uracil-DNA glycosylase family 4